ncbi:hypothetical protein ACFVFQ_31630 [Streptomyces sp. NPDC057743]
MADQFTYEYDGDARTVPVGYVELEVQRLDDGQNAPAYVNL